jgi:hypothetical protein
MGGLWHCFTYMIGIVCGYIHRCGENLGFMRKSWIKEGLESLGNKISAWSKQNCPACSITIFLVWTFPCPFAKCLCQYLNVAWILYTVELQRHHLVHQVRYEYQKLAFDKDHNVLAWLGALVYRVSYLKEVQYVII